jgi:hypothetical protein
MKKLIYITLLASIFYACNKDCERYNETRNVNISNLSYVIPYTDSSIVKFIKNGTDTLLFASQGLKETYTDSYESNTRSGGCGTNLKLQQYSLKMKHSDNEYFEIKFYRNYSSSNYIDVNINGVAFNKLTAPDYVAINSSLTGEYLDNYVINNITYNDVSKININNETYFSFKPKIGLLKILINDDTYELIK